MSTDKNSDFPVALLEKHGLNPENYRGFCVCHGDWQPIAIRNAETRFVIYQCTGCHKIRKAAINAF